MNLCVCVCACVCMHGCVCARMCAWVYVRVCLCMCVCVHCLHRRIQFSITMFLCTVPYEKKRDMDVGQIYFPFGRPGGGAPNRSYHPNQTEGVSLYQEFIMTSTLFMEITVQ